MLSNNENVCVLIKYVMAAVNFEKKMLLVRRPKPPD